MHGTRNSFTLLRLFQLNVSVSEWMKETLSATIFQELSKQKLSVSANKTLSMEVKKRIKSGHYPSRFQFVSNGWNINFPVCFRLKQYDILRQNLEFRKYFIFGRRFQLIFYRCRTSEKCSSSPEKSPTQLLLCKSYEMSARVYFYLFHFIYSPVFYLFYGVVVVGIISVYLPMWE